MRQSSGRVPDRNPLSDGNQNFLGEEKRFEPNLSKEALQQLRQKLHLGEEEHDRTLAEIIQENPNLLNSVTPKSAELGLAKTKLKAVRNDNSSQSAIKPIQQNYLHKAFTQIKPIKDKKPKNYSQDIPTKIKWLGDGTDQN